MPRLRSEALNLPSRGDLILKFVEVYKLDPLMPWQELVLRDACKVKPDGKFAHRTVGLLVPRQQGKSHVVRVRLLAGMYLWGESWLAMAQKLSLAEEHLKWAADQIFSRPELKAEVRQFSRTNGKWFIELKNGARWSAVAATQDSSRGFTGNLWVDELREVSDVAWAAAKPVTTAVPNSQVWVSSNAGDIHSTVLNDLRDRAQTQIEPRIGWFEWSADPRLAAADPEAWLQANPAVGHRIEFEVLEDAYATEPPEAFLTERLCRWVDSLDSPWAYGAWDACGDDAFEVPDGLPTWMAVDVSPDRRRADLVAATQLQNGDVVVGLVASWQAETSIDDLKVANDTAGLMRRYGARALAYDKWTSPNVAQRLQSVGIQCTDMSGYLFAQACDQMLAAMNNRRLVHSNQVELTNQMNSCARKSAADGGWRVVRKQSGGYISAACAAIMALSLASRPAGSSEILFV